MLSKQRSFLPEELATQLYGVRPQSYARTNRRTYGSRPSRAARVQAPVEPTFRLDVNQARVAAAPVALA